MNLVPNRYAEQYQQLGSDIAGTVQGAYQGYQTGKRESEDRYSRALTTKTKELALEDYMQKIEEAGKDKKVFNELKDMFKGEIQNQYGKSISSKRMNEIAKIIDGAKTREDLAKYGANFATLEDLKNKANQEGLKVGDYITQYLVAGPDNYEKSIQKAKQERDAVQGAQKMKEKGSKAAPEMTTGEFAETKPQMDYIQRSEGQQAAAGAREGKQQSTSQSQAITTAQKNANTALDNAKSQQMNPKNAIDLEVEAKLWNMVADESPANVYMMQEKYKRLREENAEDLAKQVSAEKIIGMIGDPDDPDAVEAVESLIKQYPGIKSVDEFYQIINLPKPEKTGFLQGIKEKASDVWGKITGPSGEKVGGITGASPSSRYSNPQTQSPEERKQQLRAALKRG